MKLGSGLYKIRVCVLVWDINNRISLLYRFNKVLVYLFLGVYIYFIYIYIDILVRVSKN